MNEARDEGETVLTGPPAEWPVVGARVWARDVSHPHYQQWGIGIYLGPNPTESKTWLPYHVQYLWPSRRHDRRCAKPRDGEPDSSCYRCQLDAAGYAPGTPMEASGFFAEICYCPGDRGEAVLDRVFL